MNKKHIVIFSSVVLVLIGAAWAMGFLAGKDPQVAELEKLRDENFAQRDQLGDEQRRAQYSDFREKMSELSQEQREQFFESSRPMYQRMINERMDRFFALSEEEQIKELDERIDRMEEWRKERESGGGEGRGGGGWGGRGDMSSGQRDRRRQESLDRTTPQLRAKFDRYRDMMNERREARGLDPASGRGFWRGMR